MKSGLMKKRLIIILGLLLVFLLVSCQANDEPSNESAVDWTPGTYTATAQGMNGEIKVEVLLGDTSIEEITILEHQESDGISDAAIQQIPESIIDNQSLNVDIVSGVTVTSDAIIEAVTTALEEAGADIESLQEVSIKDTGTTEDIQTNYDVVVIGAGGAGLTAAVSAAEEGAEVVVLEKMPSIGGNTMISGGEMAAPGNWIQEEEGIEDDADSLYEDILEGGDHESDPELVRVLADNALDSAIWLRDEVDVIWEDYLLFFGGHSVMRSLVPKDATGSEIINKLETKAESLGVDILTDTKATALLANEDDEDTIDAVEAKIDGEKLTFTADKGVILATGGFGANIEMRTKYDPNMDEKFLSTTSPGTTGDGIIMAEEHNAQLENMEFIQTYPTCDPETGRLLYVGDVRLEGLAILVNKEGERFVEELERRDVISEKTAETSDGFSYMFWDQAAMDESGVDKTHAGEYDSLIDRGLLVKANTIAEAAEHFDIDADALEKTVERYNEFAEAGEDLDFNKRGDLVPFSDGPYYIMKSIPAVHHTMGGVKINTDTQVIDTNGDIIKGLYAAGEITGNIQGANRLGSNAIADIIVFGRLAGQNAALGY